MAKITAKQEYIARRRVARKLSLMAMYQWHLNDDDFLSIYAYYQEEKDMASDLRKSDTAYFKALTEVAMNTTEKLDAQISPYLDRPIEQVGPVEHSVLLLGAVELNNHLDVGFKTVVNEWVNLCKKFGPEGAHKFINSILDKLAAEVRKDEMKQ
ncbi:MAG: transcription antitermination factor NusB [Thiotrichaceae bacterium]